MAGILEVPAISETGESNWPERWPLELLEARRQEVTSIYFASQYMLQPVDLSTAFLKQEWLHFYLDDELPPLVHFIGVDPSPSGRPGTDYFALAVLGLDGNRRGYLRSAYRLQIDALTQAERIKAEAQIWSPALINIEAVAAQSLFTQYFFKDSQLPIRESTTRFPKEVRIIGMEVLFENGTIRVRGESPTLPASSIMDFYEEWTNFPHGHDDVLDAVQKAIEAARLMTGTPVLHIVQPPPHLSRSTGGYNVFGTPVPALRTGTRITAGLRSRAALGGIYLRGRSRLRRSP